MDISQVSTVVAIVVITYLIGVGAKLFPKVKDNYMAGYRDWETDRKSTRLNSSHSAKSRMPSSA